MLLNMINIRNINILIIFYFTLIALVVVSRLFSNFALLNYICKPLLMPVLGLFFLVSNETNNKQKAGIFLALFFSWLGDVFLLFETKHELFFIAGLSAFLLAHLFYIFVFKLDVKQYHLLKSKPYLPLILLMYLAGFFYLLQPNLNELLLPVSVYASIICAMLLFAVLRYKQVNQKSFHLISIGAILFVLSDSVIAINKFLMPFNWAYPLIIVLYAVGQFYIIKGIVSKENIVL